LMSAESSGSYRDVEARHGKRVARALFGPLESAPRELAAVVRRLGIKAGLDVAPAIRIVPPAQSDKLLQKEVTARHSADLTASFLLPGAVARQTAVESSGGMRMPDGGFADPYKLTVGFLKAAAARGAEIFERSRVNRITFTRKTTTAFLDSGAITTTNLVICIGEPTGLFKPLKRHLRHEHRYAVLTEPLPASVRKELGQRTTMLHDTEMPPHHLWFTADHRVLFAGGDQKRQPDRLRDKTLVQRCNELMYELTRLYPAISGAMPEYGWDVPLAHAVDGALYAGSHRNFPFHHFAFGTLHDPARAFLASRIIVRNILGEPDKDDAHFSFARNL